MKLIKYIEINYLNLKYITLFINYYQTRMNLFLTILFFPDNFS